MFKRGEIKFGLTVFGLTGENTYNIKENLRQSADIGYSFVEFFIPAKAWMMCLPPEREIPDGYQEKLKSWKEAYPTKSDYFKHLNQILKWLREYNLIPIIDFGGYWRVIHKYIWCEEIPLIFSEYLYEIRKVFPLDNFIIKLINEPYVGKPPGDFVLRNKNTYSVNHNKKWIDRNVYYDVKKGHVTIKGMPQLMKRWGHFHRWIANFLEVEGFPFDNIMVDVNDNKEYPKVQAVWDMIGGCMGKVHVIKEGEEKDRTHRVFCSNHNFMFPSDLQGRVNKARRFWKYFLSNDGGSRTGLKRHGYASGPKRNQHRSTNAEELELTLRWLFNFVKDGFKNYKITVWHSDLLREIFRYTQSEKKYFDLDCIDYDRLSVASYEYRKVFGTYPENYGKFPGGGITPVPPKPEPKPKPKKEDTMKEILKGLFKQPFAYWTMVKYLWNNKQYGLTLHYLFHIIAIIILILILVF